MPELVPCTKPLERRAVDCGLATDCKSKDITQQGMNSLVRWCGVCRHLPGFSEDTLRHGGDCPVTAANQQAPRPWRRRDPVFHIGGSAFAPSIEICFFPMFFPRSYPLCGPNLVPTPQIASASLGTSYQASTTHQRFAKRLPPKAFNGQFQY